MLRLGVVAAIVLEIFAAGCGSGSNGSAPPPPPPDFTIAVQPASITLVSGTSSQVQVTESALNGFSGSISLASGPLPSGVTVTPALPQTVTTSGLSLSISVAAGAPPGTYTIPFTGTSGALQHSTNLGLTLGNRANFTIAVPTVRVDVPQAGTASVDINLSTDGGIADYTVALQASSQSIGLTESFSSPSVSPSSGARLTIAAASSAPTGPGIVTVQATRSVDGFQETADFPIYVDPKPGTIAANRTDWVRLGSNPIAAYYDAAHNRVLASLPALNKVVVIDPATGSILSSISASVANSEPNGVWVASSSNLSSTLDGKSLLVLGAGELSTIDLGSMQVTARKPLPLTIPIGWTTPYPMFADFLVAGTGGHIVFGKWGDSHFYNWDGISGNALSHQISDLYSFDRNFDGTKVLVASGDTSGAYQLLDVASDTVVSQQAYSNATIMNVRGNPTRDEWAVANSNGIDFLDSKLNLLARVNASLVGSTTYWGMSYSADGQYLYFVYKPGDLPYVITVDAVSHLVVRIAPATGTDIAFFSRYPPEWIVQPFAADNTGLVFGLGEKGLVIDDSTYAVNPNFSTSAFHAIVATPDSGNLNNATPVQITTQSYSALPDVWFGTKRAVQSSLNGAGQVSATAPAGLASGPVNIKLIPPDGYTHVMPQAFTYGTVITSINNSICPVAGGCSADIFGFGLFLGDGSQTSVTVGGTRAPISAVRYFNTRPYPYPLQQITVTVPPGVVGRADLTVQSTVGQATLPRGVRYISSIQSYPSSQLYNALLYDQKRDILYASTNSAIARFSVSSSTFLSPITPPSISGLNQFQGLSLTPDGSRLIVANTKDVSLAIIDPDNPSTAQVIPISVAGNPAGPMFVAATSTGKVLISMSSLNLSPYLGPLYELDLGTMQAQSLPISGITMRDGTWLYPAASGNLVLVRSYGGDVGIWNATTEQFSQVRQNFAGSGTAAAAADGNMFEVGNGFIDSAGTSIIGLSIPDELGGYSFFPNQAALHESGALAFIANGNTLLIVDTHHGDVLGTMPLPNPVQIWDTSVALDPTGKVIFLSDSQGLTVLKLQATPLAIGSVNPVSVAASGGTVATLRGSGLQPGTTVAIAGKSATVVFVDANTLQVTTPSNPVGPAQLVVTNPDGEIYKLDAAFLYQ